jgi:hypothetical protein
MDMTLLKKCFYSGKIAECFVFKSDFSYKAVLRMLL